MYHFLFIYQVSCFVDGVHEQVQMGTPVVQDLIRFFGLLESNHATWSVDFGQNCFVHHQVRQKFFGFLQEYMMVRDRARHCRLNKILFTLSDRSSKVAIRFVCNFI